MKKNKGFTLIELLVVIAIIGILSSVVLVSLNSARVKARTAAAQASLSSIRPAALLCFDDNEALISPATVSTAICTGSNNYPSLPAGWAYTGTVTSDIGAGTFSLSAGGDGKTITCNQQGCTVS